MLFARPTESGREERPVAAGPARQTSHHARGGQVSQHRQQSIDRRDCAAKITRPKLDRSSVRWIFHHFCTFFSSLGFAPLRHVETIVAIYIAGPAAPPAAMAIKKSNIFCPRFLKSFQGTPSASEGFASIHLHPAANLWLGLAHLRRGSPNRKRP